MKVTHLKKNHTQNPLGFALDNHVLSWIVEDTPDKKQTAAQDEIDRVLSKFSLK